MHGRLGTATFGRGIVCEGPGNRARVPGTVGIVNRTTRICAAPHAAFRRLAGEGGGVLLHLKSTAYFEVNEMGATIWEMVRDKITLEELTKRVASYEIDPDGVKRVRRAIVHGFSALPTAITPK